MSNHDALERMGAAILKNCGEICQGARLRLHDRDIETPDDDFIKVSGKSYTMELFILKDKMLADVFDNHYGNLLYRRAAHVSGRGEVLRRVKLWADEAEKMARPVVQIS